MKCYYMMMLSVFALCACAQGCNTDDADAVIEPSSSDEDADSEKGYDDDGAGDDISNSTFSKSITITYDGSSATVSGQADGVSIIVSDADVVITSSAEEMEFILTGQSSNGSVKVYSDYKYKMTFSGLTLHSATGSPVDNQSKKKLFIELADGTVNTLSDASSYTRVTDTEDLKACLFSEGQLILCGTGSLSVVGNFKHAICSDDYVAVSGDPAITVSGSVKDAVHANDYVAVYGGKVNITGAGSDGIDVDAGYFLMKEGALSVSTSADAAKAVEAAGNVYVSGGSMTLYASGAPVYDSSEADYKCAACLSSDSSIFISGGFVYAECSGVGGKALKADVNIEVSDGSLSAYAKGASNSYGSAKAVKAKQDVVISGGRVSASSASHEGIESKGRLTISGGIVEVEAADDGINSAGTMYLKGGYVYSHSTNNDAIDSNGDLIISGGTIVAYGASDPECGLDANDEENFHLYITGGYVFALGGSNVSYPYSTTGSQPYVIMSGAAADVAVKDASGNAMLAWDYSSYSSSYSSNKAGGFGGQGGPGGQGGQGGQGGMSGSCTFLVSTPDMTSGATYYLFTGVTISSSSSFHGLSVNPSVSGGSQYSSATAATSGSSSGGRW